MTGTRPGASIDHWIDGPGRAQIEADNMSAVCDVFAGEHACERRITHVKTCVRISPESFAVSGIRNAE
jgi:hypothetical protein